MYVGVDVGGTKTLVAVLTNRGVIKQQVRFPTPKDYDDFIPKLREATAELGEYDFRAAGVGIPGKVDRRRGVGLRFGNLPWENIPIQADIEKVFRCPVVVDNDANLAGLSESMLLPADKRVLYVTISTGIGTGFIVNRTINPGMADSEGGHILLEHEGRRVAWERFASGKAIVRRFGKKAADINDTATWQRISRDFAKGFIELIAVSQPDIIVIGGSLGTYFDRYATYLKAALDRYDNPLITIPELRPAARPEEAVVYGCYDLARMTYADAH